jgi:hypothetical protein
MISRCHRPTHARYSSYGGRGITVCERWRADFWAFIEDMGERPPGLTLDRTDNDAGYSPGNCRWATYFEQTHNRRPAQYKKCPNGHEYTAENTLVNDPQGRRCRRCKEECAERRAPRNAARLMAKRADARAQRGPRPVRTARREQYLEERERARKAALAELAAEYYQLGGDYGAILQLRARLGVSREVLRRRLTRAGVNPPDGRSIVSKSSPVVRESRFSIADRVAMRDLYENGLSQRQIAQRFATQQGHVGKMLRAMGVRMRPASPRRASDAQHGEAA